MPTDVPSAQKRRGHDRIAVIDILARADRAFHSVAQTHLFEFRGEVDLYPSPDAVATGARASDTPPTRAVLPDGGTTADAGSSGARQTVSHHDADCFKIRCPSCDYETQTNDRPGKAARMCGRCNRLMGVTPLSKHPAATDGGVPYRSYSQPCSRETCDHRVELRLHAREYPLSEQLSSVWVRCSNCSRVQYVERDGEAELLDRADPVRADGGPADDAEGDCP